MTKRLRAAILVSAIAAGVLLASLIVLRAPPGGASTRPGVTLVVNAARQIVITPGTPIQAEISLSGAPGAAAISVGSWWRNWHSYLRLEAAGQQTKWPATLVAFRSIASETDGSRIAETTGRIARIGHGRQVHTATYFIPPEATERIAPGEYRLRAVLQVPRWHVWGWRGTAVSSGVVVRVMARDLVTAEGQAQEARRLRYTARYHLASRQLPDARRAAEELLALLPDDAGVRMLLGDVNLADGRADQALGEYRRAASLLPARREAPELLQRRIDRALRDRSGVQNVKQE